MSMSWWVGSDAGDDMTVACGAQDAGSGEPKIEAGRVPKRECAGVCMVRDSGTRGRK